VRWRRALIVLDESTATAESLARIGAAVGPGAAVSLLSVVVPAYAYPRGMERPEYASAQEGRRVSEASARAAAASRALTELGVHADEIERRGSRVAAVVEAARDVEPDLVVIGANDSSVFAALVPARPEDQATAIDVGRPSGRTAAGGRRRRYATWVILQTRG